MKTLSNAEDRQEIITRLGRLTESNHPLWGKMTAPQMLRHCRLWEETIHENKRLKGPFIGKLIGRIILKQVLKGSQLRQNTPTIPVMAVTDTGISLDDERKKLVALVSSYAAYNPPGGVFIHPFFGKMTKDQVERLTYLHFDHHLRQFGV